MFKPCPAEDVVEAVPDICFSDIVNPCYASHEKRKDQAHLTVEAEWDLGHMCDNALHAFGDPKRVGGRRELAQEAVEM